MSVRRFLLGGPALAAVLMLVAVGCDKPLVEVSVVVSGTVLDSVSRAPIESAWVSGVPAPPIKERFYTDSLGHFSFARGPFIRDSLFAGKEGYITDRLLMEDGHADVKNLLFELVTTERSRADQGPGQTAVDAGKGRGTVL